MNIVDSSVWIDYFRGIVNPQTDKLDSLLGSELLAIGDLILAEVLQGFGNESDFRRARSLLTSLKIVDLGGEDIAIKAAIHRRTLRKLGFTVRKTVDCFIAAKCIDCGYSLLHKDRDFSLFAKHLGLLEVLPAPDGFGRY